MENNEQELQSGCFEENIPLSAQDEDIPLGNVSGTVEKGIFKVYNNINYNQKLVDAFSCTLVSAFTALSNSKNIVVPLEVIQEAFKEYASSGKFKAGFGGGLEDGAIFALKHFNLYAKTNVKHKVLPFTIENAVATLKNGFCFTSGIKY
jgi:hypothetical protein